MSRLTPLALLALTALVGGAAWLWTNVGGRAPWPAPRHVVLISIDTLRADVLGAYGHPYAKTPRLDALAAESIVFDAHITAAPSTLASHTSLFSGMPPHTHGIPRNDYLVPDEHQLLPELLSDAGWQTAAFLGAVPIASHSNFTQGFEHVDERFDRHRDQGVVDQTQRDAPDVTDAVLDWVRARQDDRSLLLFVHYFDVHAPYMPPARFREGYDLADAKEQHGSMNHLRRVREMLERGDPEGAQHARILEELYLAGVTWVDFEVGRLLDGLEADGLLDDALVIVTSDHGETFDTHSERFNHGATVYDEVVRTPLLLRFPEGWKAGDRVPHAVSNVDVLPTLLEILDLPTPRKVEGRSLMPMILGEAWWGAPRPVFSEATKPHLRKQEGWQNDPMDKAIRTDGYKLIVRPQTDGGKVELYDLRADPGELHDLSEVDPQRAADLRQGLEAWRQSARPHVARRDSSARRQAELAALGYVEEDEDGDTDAE